MLIHLVPLDGSQKTHVATEVWQKKRKIFTYWVKGEDPIDL